MLLVLAPAKDMKVVPLQFQEVMQFSAPQFLDKTAKLVAELNRLSPSEFEQIMAVSPKLAHRNIDRLLFWDKQHTVQNSMPSVLAFTGEVYRGLKASEMRLDDLVYSQNVLRILSGLYGTLRPLDLIQEHRLEMGLKLSFSIGKNLYNVWKDDIAMAINEAIENSPGNKVLINLASMEYFSAIDLKKLKFPVITASFYQERQGKIKMITVYAKRARGMMARFVIENRIDKWEDLKAFDYEGYYFDNDRSTEHELVFVR